MRRIALHLVVALAAFGVGTTFASLRPSAAAPAGEAATVEAAKAPPRTPEPFSYTGGLQLDGGNCTVSVKNYQALADGSQVAAAAASCRTPADAARWLQRNLKDAVVVKQLVLTGVCGNRVGEWVAVRRLPGDHDWKRAAILSTDGTRYRSIHAESLERALEFERSGIFK